MKPTEIDQALRPFFSVIVPCWNAGNTLASTLESVVQQEFTNWEMIVVDDGSTDNTAGIINDYCRRDSRIKSLKLDQGGPSKARNLAGLHCAKGEFLAFLDSDDLWRQNKLALSHDYILMSPEVDGFYARVAFFRIDPIRPETQSTVYPTELKPIDLLRDNPVCTMSNLVLSKEAFSAHRGFNESIIHNEDVELLVRLTASGCRIAGINETLVSYRTSFTGLSANLKSMRLGWQSAVEALQRTDQRLNDKELASANAGNLRYLARRALRTGAPGFEPLAFALAGLVCSPASFLNPFWRGGMTLACAFIAPFMPKKFRAFAFAR